MKVSKETTEEDEIVRKMRRLIRKNVLEHRVPRRGRVFIRINQKALKRTVRYLIKKMDFSHLSTITGIDVGEEIEVVYHLNRGGATVLSLKTRVMKDNPVLPTITGLIPGATLYEREVHDLLGVTFRGHTDLSPLVLPEGWPLDVYPLRKEWTIEKILKATKGGKQ